MSRNFFSAINQFFDTWRTNRGTKKREKWELKHWFSPVSKRLLRDFHYLCIWIEVTLSTTFWNNKKRYAYLVNWKRRKFHNYTQGWHSGSHAIAWAAITTFVCTGFLRPPIQNVAFAVPRFCVINGSIGTKRA